MTNEQAIKLVADDVRNSYDMTDDEAIEHVHNTVAYSDVYGDDELAQAYRHVLRAV
jgi:hypothetical protein